MVLIFIKNIVTLQSVIEGFMQPAFCRLPLTVKRFAR